MACRSCSRRTRPRPCSSEYGVWVEKSMYGRKVYGRRARDGPHRPRRQRGADVAQGEDPKAMRRKCWRPRKGLVEPGGRSFPPYARVGASRSRDINPNPFYSSACTRYGSVRDEDLAMAVRTVQGQHHGRRETAARNAAPPPCASRARNVDTSAHRLGNRVRSRALVGVGDDRLHPVPRRVPRRYGSPTDRDAIRLRGTHRCAASGSGARPVTPASRSDGLLGNGLVA